MTERLDSPVIRKLDELAVEYGIIEIPLDPDRKPVRSLEDLLTGQGRNPEQIIRSLLFRTGSDSFVLLAVAGGGRADWGVLRKHLKERRLTMAQPEEVIATTGFSVGAVPPLALPDSILILADEGIFNFERVVMGSGVLGYALDLAGADLRRLMDEVDVGHFVKQ